MRWIATLALALPLFAGCSSTSDDASSDQSDLFGIEPISTLLGNPPNFAQLGNGSAMSVVSRAEGRGSKAGALVELYWPHYASDNLWDSYVGITTPGQKLRWAHQLDLVAQRVLDDTGIVQSDFTAPGIAMRIEDVVAPGIDAHVRHVIVTNTGSEPLAGVDVTFYAFYTLHLLPDGDQVHWDAAHGALVQTDGDVTVATMGDRPPVGSHCGLVFVPLGAQRDARGAAESGHLTQCDHAGPSPAGVNGVLAHRLETIAPGASQDVTYAMGLGHDEAHALAEASRALQGGFAARAGDDRAHWKSELARAKMPAQLPEGARAVYRRAIIAMLQHRVDDGAFIAASTLTSPVYKLVWPRDGSKTAIDLLEAGYADEAKAFFVFLEQQLLSDGSFAVNYQPDGSGPMWNFGASGNENDQPGMLPWGVDRVYAATQDRAWLAARWPAVQRVAEHILTITPDGLVAPSRDLWELETGSSWTYGNGTAAAGLEAAARIATVMGAPDDATRWNARAAELRTVLQTKLVAPGGYLGRGSKNGNVDTRLEIANLALGSGGFGIFPDTDARVAGVGDLVASRLQTPSGAVRRYEGDAYYGGHPWPVAAEWLSMHRLARGDRAGAEKLFGVMTSEALTTESKMLGEQFDEENEKWVSAMPLVWSEAAYVHAALALYAP